ncbi:thiamine transport system permease protein [Cognatiyoonia koreensis]|uniref:Thiamine transport system permease protein n=1 Tax=Cognatiyoonia koreensis TaxID=364200 RepID=A0A1I0RT00_9RHOB|nr:thiamine transport system permease protein [Cognatiyoonia koreensis]
MRSVPGVLSVAVVLALTLGTLAAVIVRADGIGGLGPADWAAIRFTVSQAVVSALISVALAIPVARALARRSFRGRAALITLLGAPFLLPVIVAVLGLLAVFGRSGVLNSVLAYFGLEVSIYGYHGVVLAHVFFNLPLATRLILQGWLSIPAERFRLAATLNAPVGRFLEWPMLRQVVPGAFLVIFLICLTSFAVALILGGGPRATTIEVAIYQAVRAEFDLGQAALLACVQFALCAAAAIAVYFVSLPDGAGAGLDRVVQRWDRGSVPFDVSLLVAVTVFLAVPLLMVVLRGVPGLADMPVSVWAAALRSVVVALGSAVLCVSLALALALQRRFVATVVGALPLAASGLVMGTGLFLIVFPFVAPSDVALLVTMLVNAVLALPFALRSVAPAVAAAEADYGRLATSLGMRGVSRLRYLVLPRVRRPLGFAAGLAAALSMGDLGVITLFAGDQQATLPLAMFRLMGSYQQDAAAGAGLLLLALSLALFWVFDRGGRANAET